MATTSAAPGLRSDTLRNRKLIIRSAGKLFAEGRQATMADIARAAEVSTATAYRHFASVDEVLARFRFDVGSELLEFSQQQEATGLELLRLVSTKWVTLVVAHGRAMVHTRSGEGYLARLRTGATHLTVQADALSAALRDTCLELGVDDPGDEAMFLWNVLFDPREIFDLIETLGLSPDDTARRLVATLVGALKGWCGPIGGHRQ
ncbi:helix-turn-helix domain-containing protein [Arthrobacter sp. BE255]|uniref:TetR/AcrR family transcriptional regulator n=1 Tax=Arthrobacter sp. BE255 TaxID=2817721 RepID=UPI002859BF5A|nr:helix-turn-helix domain-containing protein [Arthrobacter sp. BE255]MDR7159676.1 AcrR family transcriptional regulator [Arthrobacter sp. BE255]